ERTTGGSATSWDRDASPTSLPPAVSVATPELGLLGQEAMLRMMAEWPALHLRRPGGDTGELKSRDLLRRLWNSAAGFWGQYGTSWFLPGALLFIVLLNLAASCGMN